MISLGTTIQILFLAFTIGFAPLTWAREVWTLHTGEGYSFLELTDPDTGQLQSIKSRCDLDTTPLSVRCLEKVYHWSAKDVHRYVNQTQQLLEAKRDMHMAYLLLSGGILSTSGKVLLSGGGLPLKIAAGISAGLSGVFLVIEGRSMAQYQSQIESLQDFIYEEFKYINRCGSPRSHFFRNLEKYGIKTYFNAYQAQYVASEKYIKAKEQKDLFWQQVAQKSVDEDLPVDEAYRKYFSHLCHQPHFIHDPIIWERSVDFIPRDVQLVRSPLMKALKIGSFEFKDFTTKDWKSEELRKEVVRSLGELREYLQDLEMYGDPRRKQQLVRMRDSLGSIVIRRRSWDWFESGYEFLEDDGVLFVDMSFSLSSWKQKLLLKDVVQKLINNTSLQ